MANFSHGGKRVLSKHTEPQFPCQIAWAGKWDKNKNDNNNKPPKKKKNPHAFEFKDCKGNG